MANKRLDEISKEIENESRLSQVKIEINKTYLDYTSKYITFIVAIVGIVTIIVGLIFSKKSENESIQLISNYVIIAGIFIALLYFIIRYFENGRVVKYLGKNFGHLKTVIDTFSSLEIEYKEKLQKLDEHLDIAKKTTANIANSPLSNLISWQQSGELEIEAQEIKAITIDLSWLNNDRLEKIFEDLHKNKNDRFSYILVEDNHTSNTNYNRIIEKINNYESSHPTKPIENLKDRLKIHKLQDIKIGKTKIFSNLGFPLPIPYDVVIYTKIDSNGNKNPTVVISTKVVPDTITEDDLMNNYDVKFTETAQVTRIEAWFDAVWAKLEPKTQANDNGKNK